MQISVDGHCPGPWGWFGSDKAPVLATHRGGRILVMDFVRSGMNGAAPRFQSNHVMKRADAFPVFEVSPEAQVYSPSIYRRDIVAIRHPDAALIAAAPELWDAITRAQEALLLNDASALGILTEVISKYSRPTS